ncbi:hypothetical protein D8M34_05825 [Microbacterium sp. HSID17254]|uniref:hypothetical protein n=1 Tax=Microbacterium sp. HSID17254 TaxID=2419509 RepID=UPI000F88F7BB|nr:hypothetical protein [Microbacterium sp. HSID17254]RUQ06987.1 hypothetical protein D8M34_05825 [Microbacterium sp. HSID17254]
MAGINPGRNAGRLSIRVIPNTNEFRRDLKRRLDLIEKSTSMTVRVTRARLDGRRIKEDIRRQLDTLGDLDGGVRFKATPDVQDIKDVVAPVRLTMDRLTVTRLRREIDSTLRDIEVKMTPSVEDRRLRQQLDGLSAEFHELSGRLARDILSPEDAEKLRLRLNDIKDHIDHVARDRETRIEANPFTAWASARLAWLTRPRTVEIFATVSKASVVSALTTLSALSGARLSWKWIDDLATSMKNLDKNLPSIIGWTTSITSLVGAIFAATSGLVGIGQGLFSILPAFLVVPGLILNAVGSLTALIVALRNTGTELAELKDDMSELGGIINDAFWGQARQPILDLVNGLMPQLRTSFHELSTGIGQFTSELAKAFGKELGDGGLERIFSGIAEGWRILSTGAPAFAGAMTSLSQVAAKYTPRLAQWFVRQANTFDHWLEAVSTDGRLDGWMENAIRSMYDLWDATTGIAGVFEGLWRAADSAGSKGLAGFADMMQQWERIVNGADFQRGLTAVFRGASVAMSAFGDGVTAIGRLILGLDRSIEKFIGSAGTFLGGLIEGAANALNQPAVDKGLLDLSDGLVRALEGVRPHLPAIAATFGSFLGLLGDLAGTLLPTAAGVLAELMPAVDRLISQIRDSGILDSLGEAVTQIAAQLGPALDEFVKAAGPVLIDALVSLADALVDILPVLTSLIEALGEWIAALGEWSRANGDFFDGVREFMGWDMDSSSALQQLNKLGQFKAKDDGNPFTVEVSFDFDRYWNDSRMTVSEKARGMAKVFMDEYERVLAAEGQGAADALVEEMRNIEGIPPEVIAKINEQLQQGFALPDLSATEVSKLESVVEKVKQAFKEGGAEGATEMWNELLGSYSAYPLNDNVRAWAESEFKDFGFELPDPKFSPRAADVASAEAKRIADRIRTSFTDGKGSKAWLSEFWSVDLATRRQIMTELGDLADEATEALNINRNGRGGGGGGAGGASFSRQLAQGIQLGLPELDRSMRSIQDSVQRGMTGSETWLAPRGTAMMGGFKAGIDGFTPIISASMAGLGGVLTGAMASAGSWLVPTGAATMNGMRVGADSARGGVVGAFTGLRGSIAGVLAGAGGWFYGVGAALMYGIARGIGDNSGVVSRAASGAVNRAVAASRAAGDIHSPSRRTNREIGLPLVQGIAVGIKSGAAGVRKSMENAIDFTGVTGTGPSVNTDGRSAAAAGGVNLHIHNPVVRDLKSEAWEAAQLVGAVNV